MTEALMEARALEKTFVVSRKPVPVLLGVSLAVRAGEAVAVVGSSGAGKTTLLQILGALDPPTGGAVLFRGQDLYGLPPGARSRVRAAHLGFVFQSYHLLPELDVRENVMLAAMSGVAGRRGTRPARRRAMDLLAAVGLTHRAGHTPAELSGGEQQRVALARALMNEPELVLADEPTGNLDRDTGNHVLDLLFDLTARRAHTLIVVTHDAAIAARCDRALRLEGGRLIPSAPETPARPGTAPA